MYYLLTVLWKFNSTRKFIAIISNASEIRLPCKILVASINQCKDWRPLVVSSPSWSEFLISFVISSTTSPCIKLPIQSYWLIFCTLNVRDVLKPHSLRTNCSFFQQHYFSRYPHGYLLHVTQATAQILSLNETYHHNSVLNSLLPPIHQPHRVVLFFWFLSP